MLERFSTGELEAIIQKFPYFQQAHILLAKKYQQEKSPKFDEQLQLAVLYAQDRELLFSIFNDNETTSAQIRPATTAYNEVKNDVEEVKLPEEPAIEERHEEIPPTENTEENALRETATPTAESEEIFYVGEEHSFDEWIQAFSRPDVVKAEIKHAVTVDENPTRDDELNKLIQTNLPVRELVEEETQYSKKLETFIEEQIQKHKHIEVKSTTSENELAPELITETIARVYEMQKKYQKAVRAYEILSLKYPEKNDFFAARIFELKNKI